MTPVVERIEAVLFDLGGTLIDSRDYVGWAADARALGIDADPESVARAWEVAEPWKNHREDSRENLWHDVLSHASSADVPLPIVRQFLDKQSGKPLYGALFSDVRRCIDKLLRSNRRLGIVSNSRSEPAVRQLLGTLGLGTAFDPIVSSGTEGVKKPDQEIFRRALVRARVSAGSALFVGDDLDNDVRAPIAAGMHAVWLNRLGTGADGALPEILSLSEVPRIIRLIEAGAPVK
jgi:putative hydrolase of the HAD superfamily